MAGLDEATAVTGSGGRFVLERLSPGRYSLQASEGNRQSQALETAVTGSGSSQEVTLLLDASGATIRGQVTGLPQTALGGLEVSASWERGGHYGTRSAADGSFEVVGVPPGIVTVTARMGSYFDSMRTESTQVQIAEGQLEATVEIRFDEGFRVEGQVTKAGEPLSGAMVGAYPEEGSRDSWSQAQTDASGYYTMEGLREGRYSFSASSQESASRTRESVEIRGDATVDLDIPAGEIAGWVVDSDTGRPLGDVQVTATSGDDWAGNARSDTSGRFVLESLEEKSYRLTFQKAAYETEVREITAASTTDVTVEMVRGEGLELVARDGIYGTPLRAVHVLADTGQGPPLASGPVELDAEGRGSLPALKPGSYALRIWSDGYAPVNLPAVSIPSAPLSVTLTPGARVEVHAGPATLERPEASVHLEQPDGTVYGMQYSRDGTIPLRSPVTPLANVAPGAYVLVTDAGERRELVLREGDTVPVTLP